MIYFKCFFPPVRECDKTDLMRHKKMGSFQFGGCKRRQVLRPSCQYQRPEIGDPGANLRNSGVLTIRKESRRFKLNVHVLLIIDYHVGGRSECVCEHHIFGYSMNYQPISAEDG